MSKLTSVSFRIDSNLKKQADELFNNLGLNMTTAFNMFLRQSVREGRIPFEITTKIPNSKTLAAISEAIELENNPNTKSYTLEDALKELKK